MKVKQHSKSWKELNKVSIMLSKAHNILRSSGWEGLRVRTQDIIVYIHAEMMEMNE